MLADVPAVRDAAPAPVRPGLDDPVLEVGKQRKEARISALAQRPRGRKRKTFGCRRPEHRCRRFSASVHSPFLKRKPASMTGKEQHMIRPSYLAALCLAFCVTAKAQAVETYELIPADALGGVA